MLMVILGIIALPIYAWLVVTVIAAEIVVAKSKPRPLKGSKDPGKPVKVGPPKDWPVKRK